MKLWQKISIPVLIIVLALTLTVTFTIIKSINNTLVQKGYSTINPITEVKNVIELLIFIGIGGLAALFFVVDYLIVSPITTLKKATLLIKGGELDYPIKVNSKDEISSLASDFDLMRIRLRTLVQNLESEVLDRTKKLNEEKARLVASIESLHIGFIIADLDHTILLKNKAIEKIFDLEQKDASIEKLNEIFGKSFDLVKAIQRSVQKKVVFETGGIVLGSKFLRIIVAPILITQNETEEIIGYVLLVEDITEAKVVERSREEFFAIASHELRTPLTAIRGNMEMLQDFWPKLKLSEKKEMIEDAVIGSKRLLALVNDFLDISRLEQGKIPLEKELIDLTDTIEKSVHEMKVLSDSKHIDIIFHKPDSPLPSVLADKERVKQILINLISNALTYTEQGSITLSIKKNDQDLSVSIIDTGKGIPLENQTLLFRKFQQASSAVLSRDTTKGTGLGLYISKLLVEQMGGTIELVESAPEKGSTFRFSLPIATSISS